MTSRAGKGQRMGWTGGNEGGSKGWEGERNKRARESSKVGEIYGADSIQGGGQRRHEEKQPRVGNAGTGKEYVVCCRGKGRRQLPEGV